MIPTDGAKATYRSLVQRIPVCTSVVGVQTGDSCFSITQRFKLSLGFFGYINPNLNCKKLFVGEWICIDGN
ncbi:hypothetical protein QVD17_17932 [Tagetes erecta]|uniref:LysM domain-containing protein n=1 Tax=Tagetes erecta TaxID=13708 RepID=A0AAD8KJQ6_TARER|nr:hypothetical protein QVD17_17932 [Tagetes erecta]